MSYAPLMIPGFESGLVLNEDDTLIPNDAFASLTNAYVWRKRLLKKGGFFSYGRLGRRQDAIAGAGGTLSYTSIEPGSLSYAEGANTHHDVPTSAVAGTIAGGTINYTTGVYAGLPFPGTMSYNVVIDQDSPVMGLFERELDPINEEECIAFDMLMAYAYNGTQFVHLKHYIGGAGAVKTVEWTGTNSDFFYATNYYGAFWATNHIPGLHGYAITGITVAVAAVVTIGAHGFAVNDIVHISGVSGMVEINGLSGTVTAIAANTITVNINSGAFTPWAAGGLAQALTHSTAASGDGIRWYAGTGWVNYAPPLSAYDDTEYLQGCKFILPFKDRFLCFNTWEGATYAGRRNYYNRVRWTARVSSPYYANLFPTGYAIAPRVWYEEPGGGGAFDFPTDEEIIGVEYLKDYIVVLFERESYIIQSTNNRNVPWAYQKLNSEFGCESSYSVIPFDKHVLSVGNRGIYQITTSGAERIDGEIPDVAFQMQNSLAGVKRVYGVRDYFSGTVLWSYRSTDTICQGTFPNRILFYNYENDTWALFKNSFTCFGPHITENFLIWDNVNDIWDDYDVLWNDASAQSNNPLTLAGNQQGYVVGLSMIGEHVINGNAITLTVESFTIGATPAVFTCINHNLEPEDYVYLSDFTGTAEVLALNNNIYRLSTVSYAADDFTLIDVNGAQVALTAGQVYYGAGKIAVLDNFEIVTKNFSPFMDADVDVRFGRADFLINSDDDARICVETYVDKAPYNTGAPTNSQEITVVAGTETKKWYTTYPQTFGKMVQLRLLFSDAFMFEEGDHDYAVARTGVDITMCRLWFSRQ